MDLLLSGLLGAFIGILVAWFGGFLGVPAPLPAIAGFIVFLVIAFYGRTWFKPRV